MADLSEISEQEWNEANRRALAIRSLLEFKHCPCEQARKVADELGLSERQIYRLIHRLRESGGEITALLPKGSNGGRGKQRLAASRELLLKRSILIDFLPVVRRSLQRDGITIDHITYYSNSLLIKLGTPVGFHSRNNMREVLTLQLMRTVGVRMLIIDEVHNLLGATANRQRELLNMLRFIGNELRIPVVCLGIRDAYLAIRSDDQLENRFHPLLLPRWESGEDFASLMASFESILPLREPSNLSAPPLSELILSRSEGTIGEITALLNSATASALLHNQECINSLAIERADYQSPSVRRCMVERELR